jgi:hypothetical protein
VTVTTGGVGEQPRQHVFTAEEDLALIGEVPEERGTVQPRAIRDLRVGGLQARRPPRRSSARVAAV